MPLLFELKTLIQSKKLYPLEKKALRIMFFQIRNSHTGSLS